jgi:polysaccharide biosynthesis/export protein
MRKLTIIISLIFLISSCKIFSPSQMLRTGAGYKYTEFTASDSVQEYKIAINDEISFRLSTNNGEKIVDPVSGISAAGSVSSGTSITFTVDFDGTIRLPVIGRVKLSGLTIREAETFLEESYTKYYNDPFVQIKVMNNRVIIFPGGEGGTASVLELSNTNTTLFEALAMAGGITDGKAFKIKLIRGDLKNPKVYLIDLSSLEGMKKANLVLQANDIIYIEPRNKIPEKFMAVISPYLSLTSFILLIYQIVK